jgi:hypothetical protein
MLKRRSLLNKPVPAGLHRLQTPAALRRMYVQLYIDLASVARLDISAGWKIDQ